jgi:hypothetical protein
MAHFHSDGCECSFTRSNALSSLESVLVVPAGFFAVATYTHGAFCAAVGHHMFNLQGL